MTTTSNAKAIKNAPLFAAKFSGRLTRDIRDQEAATNFTVAINMPNKTGGKSSYSLFADVTVYDENLRKIAKKLVKGQLVEVESSYLHVMTNETDKGTFANTKFVANSLFPGAKAQVRTGGKK